MCVVCQRKEQSLWSASILASSVSAACNSNENAVFLLRLKTKMYFFYVIDIKMIGLRTTQPHFFNSPLKYSGHC
jgi:hypothetical protein